VEVEAPEQGDSAVAKAVAAGQQQEAAVPGSPAGESLFRPTEPVSSDHRQFVPLDVVKQARRAERGVQDRPVSKAQLDRLLQAARSAFWKGSLERAESLYLRYLSMNPENANVFGELGNLYQSMGRSRDALDAYFEAGVRFRGQGDREQLQQIVEMLRDAQDPRFESLGSE
jgi:tetratricopeptide (TPR) repeat protein